MGVLWAMNWVQVELPVRPKPNLTTSTVTQFPIPGFYSMLEWPETVTPWELLPSWACDVHADSSARNEKMMMDIHLSDLLWFGFLPWAGGWTQWPYRTFPNQLFNDSMTLADKGNIPRFSVLTLFRDRGYRNSHVREIQNVHLTWTLTVSYTHLTLPTKA